MSTIHFASVRGRQLPILALLLLLALALLGGCASRQVDLTDPGIKSAQYPVFKGGDDGIPLTPAEQKALNSTGQLDRGLSPAAMQDVAAQYKYFLRKARPTMERFAQRSEAYLSHARQVFRKKGMPEELAFLAIVESGYNAKAVSPAGAAGAWQFMPYTGMKYGLNQDWWMDERLDPYKAAEAAADYLQKLHGNFKDWHLAVAAYNAGEGKISRALEGTRARTFTELKEKNHKLDYKAQLREETQNYVPRFLAICKIMRNLDSLGFRSVDMNRPAQVARVQVRPGTDLMGLAKAVNQSWSQFQESNMAHKRYVTHVDRATYVYVPVKQQAAATAYASRSGQDGNGWKSFTAGKGESWQSLSKKTGIPVAALQSANKGQNSLRPGTRLRLPAGPDFKMPVQSSRTEIAHNDSKGRENAPAHNGKSMATAVPASNGMHTLQPGDTLHGIAKIYNTDVNTLMALNNLSDGRTIRAGQSLRVPGGKQGANLVAVKDTAPKGGAVRSAAGKSGVDKAEAGKNSSDKGVVVKGGTASLGAPSSQGKQQTYVVQSGDTLWGIARKYNLSTDQLLALNKNNGKSTLRPGDKLLVSSQ